MPTRNVVLTDYQADFVEKLVASGRYQNASEVLRDGLRLVENREADEKARLKALREAARTGIADIEAGRFRGFASTRMTQDARRSRSCECFMTRWSYRAIFHRWTRWSPVGWVEERNPTSLLQSRPVGFRSSTQPTFFLEPCQEPLAACLVAGHALRASS